MNFKISVILLHLFTTTLPIGQYSSNSLSVLATNIDINDTKSKIENLSTVLPSTPTILSRTCNDRFCYNLTNEHTNSELDSIPVSTSYKEFDRFKSSSILYGVLRLASEQYQSDQCHRDLKQIYHGIHRKEIWAMKGKFKYFNIFGLKIHQ